MRLICGPKGFDFELPSGAQHVVLYGQATGVNEITAGDAVRREVFRRKLAVPERAWDLLSIALSVLAADQAELRRTSSDGWTRELELHIAVSDPDYWNSKAESMGDMLAFLTTDRWAFIFHKENESLVAKDNNFHPAVDSVALLSGGLDSLVGAIDLVSSGTRPLAVSQTVRGDANTQRRFASRVGGLSHLALNHNVRVPGVGEQTQRARSLIFITFGVLAASALEHHSDGGTVPLYLSENGFIAINPPLTPMRVGSLSTRTAHPGFLALIQDILFDCGLNVRIENPYSKMTKGEMLRDCADRSLLALEAPISTSCGRYQRHNYNHCGRCVPCQIRRAAFIAGDLDDSTTYVYRDLGRKDAEHARFDDVRSVAMAIAAVEEDGLDEWIGAALSSPAIADRTKLSEMLARGIDELAGLHRRYDVQ